MARWPAIIALLAGCGGGLVHVPFETIQTGFGPPTGVDGPQLVVIHSQTALRRRLAPRPDRPIDWVTQVALLALANVGAGLDDTPEVTSLTHDEHTLHLVVALRPSALPQGLDVTTQPWILIVVSKELLEHHLKIVYEVERQGQGTVTSAN